MKEFKVEYREKIESGEYEVETRDGRSVRIICWDATPDVPICAIVEGQPTMYYEDGKIAFRREEKDDLLVVEVNRFKTMDNLISFALREAYHLGGVQIGSPNTEYTHQRFEKLVERTQKNETDIVGKRDMAIEYGYGEIAESLYNADEMYAHATSTEEELDALEMAKEALRGLDIWAKLESNIFNSGWAECDKRKGK